MLRSTLASGITIGALASISSAAALAVTANIAAASVNRADCRCFPGDACWPSANEWNSLNQTVNGRLIATIPLAAACHDDQYAAYDEERCSELQNSWLDPETHLPSSSSIMAPFFANQSCDPFQPRSAQCVIGTYVQYAINVSDVTDVVNGLNFATNHNIRLVVRNTGHDYNGKSTGAGALGLWMGNLKDTEIKDWSDKHYTGKAIKVGAGIRGGEAYKIADAAGYQVVGGECPTVGIAGGYSQGGGHSALTSRHGLAADQVLEWEVVTATGGHILANRQQNTDLYWALSGGGGGTYGIVLSMTSKLHPDTPTVGFNLTFTSAGIPMDTYYEAITAYHAALPAIVDAGAMSVWYFTNESFAISPITAPDVCLSELMDLLAPFMDKLDQLNITYTHYFGQFETYLEHFDTMFSPIQVGIAQYGGRLIPRSVVENNNTALTEAFRFINENGGQFIGVGVNASLARSGFPENAVNPGWRDALIDTTLTTPWNFTAPWEEMVANKDKMTNLFIPKLAELTPNGSCYLNEGDFQQPNFQEVFYGKNYQKLSEIKDKYDPHHVFYATTAVGSEYWEPQEDGRLCRAT
ncbi:FAD binding domain protein [Aureobasidium subglaciale]|nr:FAD binding domain protein [Aureobasidium subglaciale]